MTVAAPPREDRGAAMESSESTAPEGIERPHDPSPEELQEPHKAPQGPIKVVHAFWLAGMSCDGCSISVTGATNPSVEQLLTGSISGLPTVVLHHPVLSVEAGEEFIEPFDRAAEGKLDAPYVVIYEGSIADERIAAETNGYFSAMGDQVMEGSDARPFPTAARLAVMAPNAAAVIAIGTCATWGGIPAAAGNPTGSMSLMDFLGADYRSSLGLPVINIPAVLPSATTSPRRWRPSCSSSRAWARCPSSTSWAVPPGSSPRPCTGAVPVPGTTRRAASRRTTATRSAWSKSAAGDPS